MKIEAGKYYKTRNGRKVFVSSITLDNPFIVDRKSVNFPVQGYIEGDGDETYLWTLSGGYWTNDEASDLAIVAEWKEPRERTILIHLWEYPDLSIGVEIGMGSGDSGGGRLLAQRLVTITEGEGME